jgi:hypothetical protein
VALAELLAAGCGGLLAAGCGGRTAAGGAAVQRLIERPMPGFGGAERGQWTCAGWGWVQGPGHVTAQGAAADDQAALTTSSAWDH